MNNKQSNFKSKAHKPLIITLVVFVLGVLVIFDFPEYISGINSLNWSKVEGTLMTRDAVPVKVGSSTVLKMAFKYQYVANGSVYFGHKLKFQEKPAFNGLEISKLEKKYKLGDKVTVFYNNSNPKQSCLEPGANFMDVVSHFVIYLIFAVIVYFSAYPRLYKFKSATQDSSGQNLKFEENSSASIKE